MEHHGNVSHIKKARRINKARERANILIGDKKSADFTTEDQEVFSEYLAVKEGVAIDTTEDVIVKEVLIEKVK